MSNHRRLLLSPLWLLVALVSTLGLNVTSAAAGSATETRVRAFEHITIDSVGQQSSERPASVGCVRPETADLASGSCVATEYGGGASLENLSASDETRIQNAANKIGLPITVVGSQATGTSHAWSDWDYIVSGANSRIRGKIRNSLPEGPRGIGEPRKIDFIEGPVNTDFPYITFNPC